jgi:hypothetical protein
LVASCIMDKRQETQRRRTALDEVRPAAAGLSD